MGKLIKISLVLIVVVVVAVVGLIMTTDINQYKDQIVQIVKDNTGRDFEIAGDLKLAPSLVPTIAIEGVTLGNADWSKEKNMLSVGKFEAQVALIPLLKKNIQVIRLILIEPTIYLETNKQGQGNWVFSGSTETQKETQNKLKLLHYLLWPLMKLKLKKLISLMSTVRQVRKQNLLLMKSLLIPPAFQILWTCLLKPVSIKHHYS